MFAHFLQFYLAEKFWIFWISVLFAKLNFTPPVQQFSEIVWVFSLEHFPKYIRVFGNDQFFPKCFNDEQDGKKFTCHRPQCESGSRGSSASIWKASSVIIFSVFFWPTFQFYLWLRQPRSFLEGSINLFWDIKNNKEVCLSCIEASWVALNCMSLHELRELHCAEFLQVAFSCFNFDSH